MIADIGIVVVLYKPNKEHISNVLDLANNHFVCVVDNTDESCSVSHANITYIPLYENKGIAYAQNIGLKYCLNEGFAYVLFLDQDSKITSTQILQLKDDYQYVKQEIDNRIGCISPVIINEETGQGYKSHESILSPFSKQQFVISSGMLLPLCVINKIGGLCEGLFIDFVDHELCFRLINNGFSIYTTRNVCLNHKIGNGAFRVLGQEIIVSKPFRYYYKYRNFIWLIKLNYIPFVWKIKTSILLFLEFICILFSSNYKNTRKEVLKNLIQGIKDGFRIKLV